jgi:hypothetical protein
MSLERRLVQALKSADRYGPSPDLFARTSLSIDEDRIYRRRRVLAVVVSTALVGAACLLLGLTVERSATDQLMVPRWALLAVQLGFQLALVIALAPAIRRFGRPLLDDAFRLGPDLVARFVRLLELAYYLLFGGLMLLSTDPTNLGITAVLGDGLEELGARIGFFCAAMGSLHALNLLSIPVAGLIYGSVARRARRSAAGPTAPPASPRAVQADRVAGVLGLLLVVPGILAVGLLVVAIIVGGLNP